MGLIAALHCRQHFSRGLDHPVAKLVPDTPPPQLTKNKRVSRSKILTVLNPSFSPHLSRSGPFENWRILGTRVPRPPTYRASPARQAAPKPANCSDVTRGLNRLIDDAASGKTVFYRIYSDAQMRQPATPSGFSLSAAVQ
jgi:hypothetical protein